MVASDLVLNPYHPQIERAQGTTLIVHPGAPLIVTGVQKLPLYRRISLGGYIETSITWDARSGKQRIRVAGRPARPVTGPQSPPSFVFEIPTCCGPLLGRVDARIQWLLLTRGFRLLVGTTMVYCEGCIGPDSLID